MYSEKRNKGFERYWNRPLYKSQKMKLFQNRRHQDKADSFPLSFWAEANTSKISRTITRKMLRNNGDSRDSGEGRILWTITRNSREASKRYHRRMVAYLGRRTKHRSLIQHGLSPRSGCLSAEGKHSFSAIDINFQQLSENIDKYWAALKIVLVWLVWKKLSASSRKDVTRPGCI